MAKKTCKKCDGSCTQDDGGERGVCTCCWGDAALLCQNCGNGPSEPCDCDAIASAWADDDQRAFERAHRPEAA